MNFSFDKIPTIERGPSNIEGLIGRYEEREARIASFFEKHCSTMRLESVVKGDLVEKTCLAS